MRKIDKLVCAPHFYTMEGEGVGYRANAAMAVDCGKILEVGPRDDLFSRYLPEEVIELKHHMVLPHRLQHHAWSGSGYQQLDDVRPAAL